MNQQRRGFLSASTSAMMMVGAYGAGLLNIKNSHASEWDKADFENSELQKLMVSLGGTQAVTSHRITLRCPELVENGMVVPLEIQSNLPNTDAIAIMVDGNPFPLAAKFDLLAGSNGYLATRIRLAQSSTVRAIIRSGGQTYSVSQYVKVTVGGCGNDSESAEATMLMSSAPMKIRATQNGDSTDIKCLMNHIMETGFRKDSSSGRVIPAHHITNVTITVAGKKVMDAQFGGGISKNPILALKYSGASKGDQVSASWVDNTGDSKTATTVIS
jgi:quinoprotein dehydrogenase-associated SoxYZ-like carrier